MSRFFDLLQRLNDRPGNPQNHAERSLFESRVKTGSDVDRALSVLLSQETGPREQRDDTSFAREPLQPSASPPEECESDSEFQRIPVEEVRVRPESRIAVETDPRGPGADRFRLLRMRLVELRKTKDFRTLLVTSSLPEEGKSTVVLNLATVLAEGGKRPVLVVEADLHRSTTIRQLGLNEGPGLAECLEGDLKPLTTLRRLNPLGWYLLRAGKAKSNPTELLQGEALGRVMHELLPHFEWILIDSPPITPLSDAMSLCRHANASILVVRAGRTQKEDVERAIELLGKQNILGILLNGVEGLNGLYSRYSTYYGNANGEASTKVLVNKL